MTHVTTGAAEAVREGYSLSSDYRPALLAMPAAHVSFDDYAAEHFGERFAVVFDDKVLGEPAIDATRFGGRAQISGGAEGFTLAEAQRLTTVLKFGWLPLEIREVSFGDC